MEGEKEEEEEGEGESNRVKEEQEDAKQELTAPANRTVTTLSLAVDWETGF